MGPFGTGLDYYPQSGQVGGGVDMLLVVMMTMIWHADECPTTS